MSRPSWKLRWHDAKLAYHCCVSATGSANPPTSLGSHRSWKAALRKTLLVVGHNPGLQDPALQLVGSGEIGMRAALNEKLPTSGLVVIDFAFDDWSRLHDHSGRLERLCQPAPDRRRHGLTRSLGI